MTVHSVTRRRPLASRGRAAFAALAAASVLATTACGSGDDDAEAAPIEEQPAATAVPISAPGLPQLETGALPTYFKHTWGVTRIEGEPKRIVVLGMREQDTMTSLGVKPLTVRNYFGAEYPWTSFPWLTADQRSGDYEVLYFPTRDSRTGKLSVLDDGPVLANGFAQASNTPERKEVFDYDAIEAMNPDLIVAMFAGIVLEDYQQLSEIAPTVTMVSSDSKDYFSSWQEETIALGKILGRPKAAQRMVDDISDQFLEVRAEYPELKEASVAVAAPGPNGTFRLMNPYAPMSRFFTALGMEFPGRIESATRYSGISRKMYGIELNYGNLSFLDGVDTLVWIVGHDGKEALDRVKATSAYKNLGVVRNNRVVELGPNQAEALYYSSVTSLPWALENIVPAIVASLGDKAARDKLAQEQAERAAEAAEDLNIDYAPTQAPEPYQRPVDEDGNYVDEDGNPVDEDGNPIEVEESDEDADGDSSGEDSAGSGDEQQAEGSAGVEE